MAECEFCGLEGCTATISDTRDIPRIDAIICDVCLLELKAKGRLLDFYDFLWTYKEGVFTTAPVEDD